MSTCASSASFAAASAPPNSVAESELIARAQQGDQDAFATLYQVYKKRVYAICLLMTGDATEAEDSAQDAFVRVFRRLSTFRGDAALSTWLYRVVVNTVLMKLRKREPEKVSYDNPVVLESSMIEREFGRMDSQLMGVLDRIALARALKDLPPGYRTIFILHDVQGYEHHEIARMLRCSLGTSKSQLHKARLRIRELLLAQKKGSLRKAKQRQETTPATAPGEDLVAAADLAPDCRQGTLKWPTAAGNDAGEMEQEAAA